MKPVIITPARVQKHPSNWKNQLKFSAQLPPDLQASSLANSYQSYLNAFDCDDSFPLRIPHSFISRMLRQPDGKTVLKQFIPDPREHHLRPGFVNDPVNDIQSVMAPGLLHKYRGRALIVTTGACPIHCRYCFRRNFNYQEQAGRRDYFKQAYEYIAAREDIHEVILSGGDPLSLSDKIFTELLLMIKKIDHISTIRIHTRYPIILPDRLTADLLHSLATVTKSMRLVVVLHTNHAQELDEEACSAIQSLMNIGASVLNQSVLLKGINSDAQILINLSMQLHRAGVLPYYLHLLDPVSGSHHFHVEDDTAKSIYSQIQGVLPGYLVPRLVREVAGTPAKQLIFSQL